MVTLVVLTAVIGLCCIKSDLVISYLGRFTSGMEPGQSFTDFMGHLTTYRYTLWVNYTVYLVQHPLVLFFGRSLGTIPLYTPANNRIVSPHNFS